jgi:hypothetical protein
MMLMTYLGAILSTCGPCRRAPSLGGWRCPGLLDVTRVLRQGHSVGNFSWPAVCTSLLWRYDRKRRPAQVTVRFCVSGTCKVINYRACRWMGTLDTYFLEWRGRIPKPRWSRCYVGHLTGVLRSGAHASVWLLLY